MIAPSSLMTADSPLIARLMPDNYKARPEQALLFGIAAWDTNCPQYISRKVNLADVAAMLSQRDERIAEVETQLAQFHANPVKAVAQIIGARA